MVLLKVVRRLNPLLYAMLVMAALACPVFAATVDAEQSNALAPAGTLDLKTGDDAAQAGANAAAAAHGITVIPPAANTPASVSNTSLSTAATPANPQTPAAKEAASAAKPIDIDLRRAVRDATKPVLDDLARSAVGEAVRGVAASDDPLDDDKTAGDETAGRRRNWDGQQAEADNGTSRRTRTDAELANDKAKASFLFQALVNEVAPWALAAVVLYVLFYALRFVLALRRRLKAEKRDRRRQNDRRRGQPQTTSRGTPTQR